MSNGETKAGRQKAGAQVMNQVDTITKALQEIDSDTQVIQSGLGISQDTSKVEPGKDAEVTKGFLPTLNRKLGKIQCLCNGIKSSTENIKKDF